MRTSNRRNKPCNEQLNNDKTDDGCHPFLLYYRKEKIWTEKLGEDLANLEPIIGSEQGGVRPVLIIQNNKGNKHSGTTIAAPITTKRIPNRLPVHVYTFAGNSGLPQNSSVMLEQIRVLDKSRLTDYVGRLNDFTMDEVDRALKISVGLNSKYN